MASSIIKIFSTLMTVGFLGTSAAHAGDNLKITSSHPAFIEVALLRDRATDPNQERLSSHLFRLAVQCGAEVSDTPLGKVIILEDAEPHSRIEIRTYPTITSPLDGVYFTIPVASFAGPYWHSSVDSEFEVNTYGISFSGPAARTLYALLNENVNKGYLEAKSTRFLGAGGSAMINRIEISAEKVICAKETPDHSQTNHFQCFLRVIKN